MALQKCIHLGSHEKLKKAKEGTFFIEIGATFFMARTSNSLIENTSSAEGTSTGGTSAEGTFAGGTFAGGTFAGGTFAGGPSAEGTFAGGTSAEGTSAET